MFVGTVDRANENRTVLVETHYSDMLDTRFLPKGCFSLVIIKSGGITVRLNGCERRVDAPAALCLDERKNVELISDNGEGFRIINFDPRFLNVNMRINTIRSGRYEHLCQLHAFFQLSPFLADDIEKACISLEGYALERIEYSFENLTKQLEEQRGWYWSCKARSYFIDIINVLERLFYDFYVEGPGAPDKNATVPGELKKLLVYINSNLDKRLTLDSLYREFRINKNKIERLFRDFLSTTFYEYLRNRRYEQAADYLRFTELDGKEIAERIGISSSQNFCKFFKQMSGCSPNAFRKERVANRKNDPELRDLASKI